MKWLAEHPDWPYAFGEHQDETSEAVIDVAPPKANVSLEPFTTKDVNSVIALYEEDDDGWTGCGVFYLHDGRYGIVSSWCDFTGWG